MPTDGPWGAARLDALRPDGKRARNDRRRRLEAVRWIRELHTSTRGELRVDENELWSQLFHHNE